MDYGYKCVCEGLPSTITYYRIAHQLTVRYHAHVLGQTQMDGQEQVLGQETAQPVGGSTCCGG